MTSINFEFVSTHRNRSLWPNPCAFEVPWSGNGQFGGLESVDPISLQAPIIDWKSQIISISATVVSQNAEDVIVSAPINSFSQLSNFYQGAEFKVPPSFRIDSSSFLSQFGGQDFLQLKVRNSGVSSGDAVTIQVTQIPNTLFVPGGSDQTNAYNNKFLFNETHGEWVQIGGYDAQFHKVLAQIPLSWSIVNSYSIRSQLPSVINFPIVGGSTQSSMNLTGITPPQPGDFIRILTTGEIVKIINFSSPTATVSPHFSTVFPAGTLIEILNQSMENYKPLSYSGTIVGQREQIPYEINLVSGTLPNIEIKNGEGGYPIDYPFLYVEFFDTNFPTQNNLFSNNHSNKSYFKVTTPTGLFQKNEKFTKFSGDLNFKTIRFRPTSNFRIVWRFPSGEEIQFVEQDSKSPQSPKENLQTSVLFNLR